jgi:SAM-dependent methyltransferase
VRPTEFYDKYIWSSDDQPEEDRLRRVVRYIPAATRDLLDIGTGRGRNLRYFAKAVPEAHLCGTDVAPSVVDALASIGFEGKACDASQHVDYPDAAFDVVVAGEVIEHVVDTDTMVREFARVLRPGGTLILTTPNLAYLPNRLLLLAGIQPLFTETSLVKNLGRRSTLLGQGNPVQGHLRIFTLAAARELLEMHGFQVIATEGYRWRESGVIGAVDAVLQRVPSFAAGFILVARTT